MILQKLISAGGQGDTALRGGYVSYSDADGFAAAADGEYRSPMVLSPAGIGWKPREGDAVLLLTTPQGCICAGVATGADLAPGELKLTGPAGNYIWLKSDGTVVVNGAIFSPSGTLTQGVG